MNIILKSVAVIQKFTSVMF